MNILWATVSSASALGLIAIVLCCLFWYKSHSSRHQGLLIWSLVYRTSELFFYYQQIHSSALIKLFTNESLSYFISQVFKSFHHLHYFHSVQLLHPFSFCIFIAASHSVTQPYCSTLGSSWLWGRCFAFQALHFDSRTHFMRHSLCVIALIIARSGNKTRQSWKCICLLLLVWRKTSYRGKPSCVHKPNEGILIKCDLPLLHSSVLIMVFPSLGMVLRLICSL